MKILFTGTPTRPSVGTWHMRAVQMASTHKDWKAIPDALPKDFEGIDAVVLIKKTNTKLVKRIKNWGGYFIYDPLDFWKQPHGAFGIGTSEQAQRRFKFFFQQLNPDLLLTVNQAMKNDLKPLVKRAEILHHHYDPEICPPYRKDSNKIVYWGHPRYLGPWKQDMYELCRTMGYDFEVNPRTPYSAAAMFAVRAGDHGSWLARRWKSGVKGATAVALGVPFIAWPEESYLEMCGKYLYYFTHKEGLANQIERAMDDKGGLEPCLHYSVENSARNLEKILENI